MSGTQENGDNADWVEWNGGECPVTTGTLIDVELRHGQKLGHLFGSEVDWRHDVMDDDIIAYRIHKES
ncbi:hypothetical protein [Mesorhizobium sp.]|uniref:hypothetical protein n=1 Tax=Mesorhizobium sp. TaxID=1871066 RepID=UPI000FE900E3|nr:hypothetical protein [Mesorhizobium sp.]RWO20639.1 MAG: hypothetical protein EOS09_26325 [Mesorhizobium sp.]